MSRIRRSWALLSFAAMSMLAMPANAISATFVKDFEDGVDPFEEGATTSHTIGGGVSSYDWSVVDVSGNKALREHIFLHNLADDSASLVYTSKYFSTSNVAGSRFKFSVDVDISQLIDGKANDPAVADKSFTIALGALGSGAFSPGSFVGFKDINDGQHYYLAVYTRRLGGDAVDPWASDTAGKLHLFEHNGDGQVDFETSKSLKASSAKFTFSIEGTYNAGQLTLEAKVDDGNSPISAMDTDTTPLTGSFFGFRSAAFSRSGTVSSPDVTFDVDYDNVTIEKDYQPDASIAKGNGNRFKGEQVVNTSGSGQQAKVNVSAGGTATATVHVRNSGTNTDDITVTGAGSAAGFAATYLDGNTNVTHQVTGNGYTVNGLAPGQTKTLKLRVVTSGGASGSKSFKISTQSSGDSGAKDAVKAKITIK